MEAAGVTARTWWVVPPPGLRGPFVFAFTIAFIAVAIVAAVTLDVAVSSCSTLGPCDANAQWALLLPLWWPAILTGRSLSGVAMALVPPWWLLLTWIVTRTAFSLWLRSG